MRLRSGKRVRDTDAEQIRDTAAPHSQSCRLVSDTRDVDCAFTKLRTIGDGGFGSIHAACRFSDPVSVVALKVPTDATDKIGLGSSTLREVGMLRRLTHPHIIDLLELVVSKASVTLVLGHMDRNLKQYVRAQPGQVLSEALARSAILQLARGLAHCHSHGVMHRDVKPQNVLVGGGGPVSGRRPGLLVRLADFGEALRVVPGRLNTLPAGTPWYYSPEMLLGDAHYGTPTDVWSLGCTYAEVRTGQPLFPVDVVRLPPEQRGRQMFASLLLMLGAPDTSPVGSTATPAPVPVGLASTASGFGPAPWPGARALPQFGEYLAHVPASTSQLRSLVLQPAGMAEGEADAIESLLAWDPKERPTTHDLARSLERGRQPRARRVTDRDPAIERATSPAHSRRRSPPARSPAVEPNTSFAAIEPSFLAKHAHVSAHMRRIVVGWIAEVYFKLHRHFAQEGNQVAPQPLHGVWHLSVHLVDVYLQADQTLKPDRLQLLALASVLIASKVLDCHMYHIHVRDLVFISAKAFSHREIRTMECEVLRRVDANIAVDTVATALEAHLEACDALDADGRLFARYLSVLALYDVKSREYTCGELASACASLAAGECDAGHALIVQRLGLRTLHSSVATDDAHKNLRNSHQACIGQRIPHPPTLPPPAEDD